MPSFRGERPPTRGPSPDTPDDGIGSSSYHHMRDDVSEIPPPAPSGRRPRGSRPQSPRSSHVSSPRSRNRSINNNDNSDANRSPTSSRPTSPDRSTTSTPTTNYRGFSTSIGDMFANPQQERVDCCALTCCGVFQSDRDRYLLQGVTPPSPWKRLWVHLILPLILFFTAGYVAVNVREVMLNELLCLIFLGLLLAGLIAQCHKGRSKRTDIRKDVLWYKYQLLQHRHSMSIDQILDQTQRPERDDVDYYFMGQTHWDIGCSHPHCFALGCYATDRPVQQTAVNSVGENTAVEESLCSCLFKTFCSPICGMHLQVGGVCGMAQESREIETLLLPPAYRRLDYVTMQPMLSYFENIYNQRWRLFLGSEGGEPTVVGPFSELPFLSQLSKTMLQAWAALTIFLGVWSVVGPIFWTQFLSGEGVRHYFGVGDFVIYLSTWVSNSIIFAVVFHFVQKNNALELSIDAMIKYFSCGFFLSTTVAIFYELVIGITLRLILLVLMAFSGVDVVQENDYSSIQELAMAPLTLGFGGDGVGVPATAAVGGDEYLRVFGRDHPVVYSFYLFVQAFILAALIEEICKYFGYRMMEHPDLNLTQHDLEEAASAGVEERLEGRGDEHDDDNSEHNDGRVVGSSATRRHVSNQRRVGFAYHGKSHQAKGAAITVAMVCVAIGFSVAEDLSYIFFHYGSSVKMEIYVLVARTLFPIHPICAALQSIGVTERDVENTPTRFGRILLPAVLFHGTYDFIIIWLDFLDSLKRQDGYGDTDDEYIEAGPFFYVSLAIATALMAWTLYWYYRVSKRQRERLASYDTAPTSNFARMA